MSDNRNAGNFANRAKEDVRAAASKGGRSNQSDFNTNRDSNQHNQNQNQNKSNRNQGNILEQGIDRARDVGRKLGNKAAGRRESNDDELEEHEAYNDE